MSIVMVSLSAIEARIIAACPIFRLVEGAAEYRAVKGAPQAHLMPAAWVVPMRETAEPSPSANAHRQRVTVGFGVVVAVGDRAAGKGPAVVDPLDGPKWALHEALAGWTPPGGRSPLHYLGGEVHDVTSAALWWLAKYGFNDFLRGVSA